MGLKEDRRDFLKKIAFGGLGAATLPGSFLKEQKSARQKAPVQPKIQQKINEASPNRDFNGVYEGAYLNYTAFPIGGIGAGMFCLDGRGSISHMSVRHGPQMYNQPEVFGAISVKGMENGAKILARALPDWRKFGLPGSGNGGAGTIYGLPNFRNGSFQGRFPFANIELQDQDLPLDVQIEGWSPFIPTDEDNSSLPVGALEYSFTNTGNKTLEAVFSMNSKNFIQWGTDQGTVKKIDNGFVLSQGEEGIKEHPHWQGDFAIYTDNPNTVVDHHWFRGGWWDPITMVWNTIEKGEMNSSEPIEAGAPGASLFVPLKIKPGQQKKVRVMMAWYVPLSNLRFGDDVPTEEGCGCTTPAEIGLAEAANDEPLQHYKPWYSSKFYSVHEVADYWKKHYDELHEKSMLFKDAFFSSTLPSEVVEAVSANLSILKSPTVMRQPDGRMWNWEGCSDNNGCCHGSCTHVWNYAQAVAHLFPSLERSLRETEFCEDQNAKGHQNFRSSLPIRTNSHDFYAAADGQLGGIMKIHREWRISGDNEWLKKMFPLAKTSLDFCIRTWDPKHKGIVEEPHHNTYDIEFWGPDGMCTSFYLGALQAFSKMGDFLNEDVNLYKKLYRKGKKYVESKLYNGEYFFQEIKTEGLQAPSPIEEASKSFGGEYSEEALELLKKEGPKYQYGIGCLSDGVLGGWIARMCSLEDDPLDTGKTRSHLLAVHKYNLKHDLSDHPNPQRPTYALDDEGGLLLCTWPNGGKLSLPFVYSNEVWTGIEYQVASHLMLIGEVEKGLEIVRTCRNRYDGRIRNPFDEYECGNWYARALSSYGLLQGLTGVRYDALEKRLYIDSNVGDFTTFLSTESGFGTVSLKGNTPSIDVFYGEIPVDDVSISGDIVALG